jgi:hypothetical protein
LSSRLEPSPRSLEVEEGLAARVHDALWLLARQWQFGEFEGKDAGTPVKVHASGAANPVTAWRGLNQDHWTQLVAPPGSPDAPVGTPLDALVETPLDALVETEDEAGPSLRERVEAGAHFIRLLSVNLVHLAPAFRQAHPFGEENFDPSLPPFLPPEKTFVSDSLFAAIARRTPDGLSLRATVQAIVANDPQPVPVEDADKSTLIKVCEAWLDWYGKEIHTETNGGTAVTWQENRLEYGFKVSTPAANGTVLVADGYRGDGLDWFDFDIAPGEDADPGGKAKVIDVIAVPHPVHFAGMPLPRFWAMEDALCDFGSIEAAPNDIGRLLMVEFTTLYGNDWFVLPLKIQAGTYSVLDQVTVTDVFGRTFVLTPAGQDDPNWNLFSLNVRDPAGSAREGLLLPPASAHLMEGSPVETVLYLRDEMADLAWGVEARFENTLGRSLDRRSAWVAPGALAAGTPDLPVYRVQTVVPDYWIPLAPEKVGEAIHLRLVPLEVFDGERTTTAEPKGILLSSADPGDRLWLFEEEIPREGTLVDRVYRLARWQDGHTSLWSARRRRVGRGEGSSGLRFDVLDPG